MPIDKLRFMEWKRKLKLRYFKVWKIRKIVQVKVYSQWAFAFPIDANAKAKMGAAPICDLAISANRKCKHSLWIGLLKHIISILVSRLERVLTHIRCAINSYHITYT